eukprot:6212235-Pleurochrysis_carterae.AAC.2
MHLLANVCICTLPFFSTPSSPECSLGDVAARRHYCIQEEAVSADVSSVPRVEPPRRCIPKVLGFLFSRPHSQWRDDREALV